MCIGAFYFGWCIGLSYIATLECIAVYNVTMHCSVYYALCSVHCVVHIEIKVRPSVERVGWSPLIREIF